MCPSMIRDNHATIQMTQECSRMKSIPLQDKSQSPIVELDSDASPKRKSRKRNAVLSDVEEKVWWTDESDSIPQKRKRRRGKRKSASKEDGLVAGQRQTKVMSEDDLDLTDIPEYIKKRRRAFIAKKRLNHEAALFLPPDYIGLEIDDAKGAPTAPLRQRPLFDVSSGVNPVRPFKDIELPHSAGVIPAAIAQYLRDYQVAGVKFLHEKFVYQEGGILGDDMGLGKTVQVAAFLIVAFGKTGDERDDGRMREVRSCLDRWYPRILVICPGSLIMNWRNEMNRWGWWHIDIFHGANKDDVLGTARSGLLEIMITTYDTYKNNRSAINLVSWDAVICDECHRLKDSNSETARALAEVNALCRLGLTGTAIQNNYEELWTLLDWTMPGHFGSKAEWNQAITRPLTVGQSHDATVAQLSVARLTARKLVQNLLPRFFLRRLKTLIADQLPKKTDRVVFCPLTNMQTEAYNRFLNSPEVMILRTVTDLCTLHGTKKGWCCLKKLSDGSPWQRLVFPSVMVLQKLANHLTMLIPSTMDGEARHEYELKTLQTCVPDTWQALYEQRDQIKNLVNPEFCGKWKVLRKLLKFWHEKGDKVLVFSHSVRLLRILQYMLTSTSYNVSFLDGSLTYEQRQDVVDTFNSDPAQFVFLISIKAGGVGLNITAANKVVVVDPHWNPSYDLQAQDRAYRIGQTRDVEVFRLVALGTVEEIVYARQIYKQQQANIAYTASSERRYFKGVQQDTERQGEIFGLANLFTLRSEVGLLRDIVNKTNIAEAKAGVHLIDFNVEEAAREAAREEERLNIVKKEEIDAEDGGLNTLAAFLRAEDQEKMVKPQKRVTPRTDAIQAILTSAGVGYTHENAQVIGSSTVEAELSRQAALTPYLEAISMGQGVIFADDGGDDDSDLDDDNDDKACLKDAQLLHSVFRPPEDVCKRQFCEMAREFGFANATDFALVVEGSSHDERSKLLDTFYCKRGAYLIKARDCQEHNAEYKIKLQPSGCEVEGLADSESKSDLDMNADKTKIKLEPLQKRDSQSQKYAKDEDDDDEL